MRDELFNKIVMGQKSSKGKLKPRLENGNEIKF